MIKIIVCGMPRSGTSLVSHLLTQNGMDFVSDHETVDSIYDKELNKNGYFQIKLLHEFLDKSGAKFFDENKLDNEFIEKNFDKTFNSIKSSCIKDPYLLYLLPKILKDINPDVLCIMVIRNKQDTLKSIKKFVETQGYIYNHRQFSQFYDDYYQYFNKIKKDIKNCIIFNYDDYVFPKKKIDDNFLLYIFCFVIIYIIYSQCP